MGEGVNFFTGLNKNIKISELIATLECIELKSTGRVRLSCRQKRADKILTGHLKPMLKRTGGSWIESFCRPSTGITSTPKVHMLLPSTCAMKCFKHTRNFVSQRRPVALLPSPFAGKSAAAQSLSSALWWNRLSRSSKTLWGPASRPPTRASWNRNRSFVKIIPW